MKLQVMPDPQDSTRYWVFNPLGGKGHWIDLWPSGRMTISEDWHGAQDAPENMKKALRDYLQDLIPGYRKMVVTAGP